MTLSFDQLVEALHERSSEELRELIELAQHFAREARRDEILRAAEEGRAAYGRGELQAHDNIQSLMRELESDD